MSKFKAKANKKINARKLIRSLKQRLNTGTNIVADAKATAKTVVILQHLIKIQIKVNI